jgi:hypothetical protein
MYEHFETEFDFDDVTEVPHCGIVIGDVLHAMLGAATIFFALS